MILIRFVATDGTIREVAGRPGDRLLDLAQADGQPLEGTCEGQMACSTCHVIVAPEDFAQLPPASADEEDMLDFATGATRTSRLACQIRLAAVMTRLTVKMPG
jgi:ferredoxin